eukprot:TRINITY_DN5040_c0_g1_i4.p1 TRINITY_DN5040_c0_g1~~TRINITY_DN5040_c0_g1_i4.p1  ORF type:complete len:442 (-),score=108.83 TRINITY_DN5040_c0_g1_i4:312-1637(-)
MCIRDRCGVTIVCTIHQPSSEVFALFDDVMLLADGQLVYHGTCSRMLPYFAHHGWECKPNYNPADFVMFLMQEDSRGDGSPESVTAHAAHLGSLWGQSGGLDLERQAVGTPNRRITQRSPYMDRLAALGDTHDGDRYNAFVQLGWLARREARNLIRNKGALYAQFGVTVFLNLIIGLVFKDAGKWTDRDVQEGTQMSEAIQNHFGALTQVGIGAMFGLAQPALLSFPLERPVFLREHATDMYRAWPYFLSKCMCEVPMALIQTALIFVVTYWLIGFQGEFFFLSLACALLGITAASTSLLVGSVADNVTTAIQATPMLFVPQLLFSGFFISINKIPAFMRWAQYLCSLKYGINLLMIAEFDHLPDKFKNNPDAYYYAIYGHSYHNSSSCPRQLGCIHDSALFPRNEVNTDSKWIYVAILLGLFTAFRVTSAVLLTARAKRA